MEVEVTGKIEKSKDLMKALLLDYCKYSLLKKI